MTRIVLCWDIDGTLLTTGEAGRLAWEDAIAEIYGSRLSLSDYRMGGLTDVVIARTLLPRIHGSDQERSRAPGEAERLLRRYERRGRVMPGVLELLDDLADRREVMSILLTGNTAAGARAKLSHYALAAYFAWGAFADGTVDRAAIGRQALQRIRQELGSIDGDCFIVIGDTPHDIATGDTIGARTLAVATGTYSLENLAAHDPWWLLPRLPSPKAFRAKLGIP